MSPFPLRAAALLLVISVASCQFAVRPCLADSGVSLIASTSIPGDAHDKSGLTGTYSGDGVTIPKDQLGAFGSGITYSGTGDLYFGVNDRGLANGDVRYDCRFQEFEIAVDPAAKTITPTLVATKLLTDEMGRQFVGSAADFADGLRLDSEAIRFSRTGTLFISDEYGPFINEFDRSGKRIRSLPVPAKFEVAHPAADDVVEVSSNTMGRQTNRGFEGMAITPDGSTLYAILQSPLIQDHGLDAKGKRAGINDRILRIDPATGVTAEFLYRLDEKSNGVNEMLAVNDHQFLVIERDGKSGTDAKFKKIFLVDVAGATDISATGTTADNGLPQTDMPDGVTPVKKTLFLDLLDPSYSIAGESCPEKFEGMAFGPDLPGGRHLLIVTVDNDLIVDHPNWFYAFAIDPSALPGFQKQKIDAKIAP